MKKKALFITGTDTDIGKTYVSRLLADTFHSLGEKISYIKPVQTGCVYNNKGKLTAPDADYVFGGSAIQNKAYEYHVPYRFEPACSPHLAARQNSVTISFDTINNSLKTISSQMDMVLVEGAGGILAPLSETTFMLDLMCHLDLPVILVTTPKLGTLNHTLLSVRAIIQSKLTVAGVVINNADNHPNDFICKDNVEFIKKHINPAPVIETPFGYHQNKLFKEFCNDITKTI